MSNTKYCPGCKTTFPVTEFYRHGHGLSGWCKACCRAATKRQRQQGYWDTYKRPALAEGVRRPANGERNFRFRFGRFTLTPVQKLARALYKNAQTRAVRSLKEFTITALTVESRVEEFCAKNHHSFTTRDPFLPSLDRIDSNKGYTPDNVRVVWMIENLARNLFTDGQVIEFCQRKLGTFGIEGKERSMAQSVDCNLLLIAEYLEETFAQWDTVNKHDEVDGTTLGKLVDATLAEVRARG